MKYDLDKNGDLALTLPSGFKFENRPFLLLVDRDRVTKFMGIFLARKRKKSFLLLFMVKRIRASGCGIIF